LTEFFSQKGQVEVNVLYVTRSKCIVFN